MFLDMGGDAELTTKKISRHTWKEVNMVSSSFHCLGCQQFFEDNKGLRTHLSTHAGFVCKQCEISTKNYDLFINHCLTF